MSLLCPRPACDGPLAPALLLALSLSAPAFAQNTQGDVKGDTREDSQEEDVEIEVVASPAPPAAAAPPPSGPPPAVAPAPPAAPAPAPAPPSPPALPEAPARAPRLPALLQGSGVVVGGYLQPQVEWNQRSEDEVDPEGDPLNFDRFVVRRGRLRAERSWPLAHAAIEIDANTVRGPFLSLRRAEASLLWPSPAGRDPALPPLAQLTVGLQEIPFGFELRQGNAERVFVERTTGSLAFFRGEPDTGARLSGALGPLRYGLALMNGVPVDDRPGAVTQTYTAKKTRVGRVGLSTPPGLRAEAAGGLSALTGTGFHAGNTATKSQLLWRDLNQDGLVALSELAAQPGQAATPSETYERWGMNSDLQLGLRTAIGWTRVYGEVTLASNLDRGLFVADPISTGYDLRELAWNVGVVQELSPWGLAGLRFDAYDGNADATEARRGRFVPTDQTITTTSALIGLRLPELGRLMVQYDYVSDHLGRDDAAEPVDLANDLLTLRVQVEL